MDGPGYQLGFSTLDREIVLDRVSVQGSIPEWLSGTLLRTGPAQFEVGSQPYRHWFDGLAMLHKFSFQGGQVSYANRFLQSQSYCEAKRTDRISRREFATDPCLSLFGRVRSLFMPQFTDNGNVNIQRLANRYVALTEVPLPISFDPETLQTLGPVDYGPAVSGQVSTAHPHFDYETKRAFNYQVKFGRVCQYQFFGVAADREHAELIGSLRVDKPAYMHSFGMTQRYIVLTEFPLVVSPLKLMFSGLTQTPFIENYRWRPQRGLRFSIIDKADGRVVTRAEADACFSFHHVNAFEESEGVAVDLITYDDASIIDTLYLDKLRKRSALVAGRLQRFRVPFNGSRVTVEDLAGERLELPRINYRRGNTRQYRYVFGTGSRLEGNFIDQLVKIDVADGSARTWFENDCYPGEPVFVASSESSKEDAGLVLSVVLDGRAGRSFLLVLDGETFDEQARAQVPHHIPFGFHGQFFHSPEAGN